jgi:predicted O-methyltransferase YrrM
MSLISKLLFKPRNRIISSLRRAYNHYGLERIRKNNELWDTLDKYIKFSQSTGCAFYDYWVLYSYIRKNKPKEVLECGTGVSTIVMAHAMMENEMEGNGVGRITSMEDKEEWFKQAVECLPDQLRKHVDLVHSEKVEYCYSIFRGVGYKYLPERPFEFVFVDGPGTIAPSDGTSVAFLK